jgi:hypothetical protein
MRESGKIGKKRTAVFSRRGLIAEHGISWILPRIVGLPIFLKKGHRYSPENNMSHE